jgi:hypothetical protein
MGFVEFFRAIPEGIWGVIVGSLLTFVGVGRQLHHDSWQRDRDRAMQLRRDVFLEAADGAAGTTTYFVQLANINVPMDQLNAAGSKQGWLNKIYTVASLEAIEAFSEASAALGASAFDLVKLRLGVEEIGHKIDAANGQVEAIKGVQQRISEAAAAALTETPTPVLQERVEAMQKDWVRSWQEIETVGLQISDLWDEKLRRQRALLERAVQYSIDYQKTLRRALIALRVELEIPLDVQHFNQVMDRIDATMLSKLAKLLDTLDAESGVPV